MLRRTRWLAVLLGIMAFACNTAQAQVVKPFKIVGTGPAPSGLSLPGGPEEPHSIVGEATYLGRHTGSGTEQTDKSYTQVRYRDHWYWIDDRDMASKRVFTFLTVLFTLSETGQKIQQPILTIRAN